MKSSYLWTFLGVTCSLLSQTVFAQCPVDFGGGSGFDCIHQLYRWDSGAISSSVGVTTNFANNLGPTQLSGVNSTSFANAFSTTHRLGVNNEPLLTDTITAIQIAFTDIVASFKSFQCREGSHLATTIVSPVGQTITLAIWDGSVPAGCQKLCNACYTQEYTIQPEDVGITSNFKSRCPSFNCDCFDSPCISCEGSCVENDPVACINCSFADCGTCGTNGDCGCVFEGNGSNVRPLVTTVEQIGCEDHTRRVPPNVNQGTGQDGKNPFSEYPANFTTILLDRPVHVETTFWVGFVYDFSANTLPPLDKPTDDYSINLLGLSVVNFDAPQPQGNCIDLTDIPQFNSSEFLENNMLINISKNNKLGLHPISNGFTLIPPGVLIGDNLPRRQDEFYAIRAVPQPLGLIVECSTVPNECDTPCPNNGCP